MTPDQIIDRRRMKRRVTFWRVASLVLLGVAIFGLLSAAGIFDGFGKKNVDHIARVSISGVITNDKPLLTLLDDLKDEDHVKAVILDISSPGGSTVGGEAVYEAVLALGKEKPVATSVGTLAASAGYMIAVASDHIVARRSSIVGSIGVIFQYGQVSELLKKIGVEVKEIKSSPLKAEPSPFHKASPEAKAVIERLILDTYNWFVGVVAERRGFTDFKVKQLADGSIFTGSQGVENGLIDAIGDEQTAKNWLIETKELSADLEIITWKPVRKGDGLFANPAGTSNSMLIWIAQKFGLSLSDPSFEALKKALPSRLFLDGLISMLHIEGKQDQQGNR